MNLDDDEFLEKYRKGEVPRYTGHFSDDNFLEEMDSVPLFMRETPESIDPEKQPAVAALQALAEEEQDPVKRALYHKDHGNEEFKKGRKRSHMHAAITAYSAGIAERCPDATVHAALYSNRAMVHLTLQNYRSAVDDCKKAVEFDKSNVKTYFRAAKSLVGLERYAEAVQWCDDGLELDGGNAPIQEVRKRAAALRDAAEKEARKRERARKQERAAGVKLANAVRQSGVTARLSRHSGSGEAVLLRARDLPAGEPFEIASTAVGPPVRLAPDGTLHWQVLLLYPEVRHSDCLADVAATAYVGDILQTAFGSRAPWDELGVYTSDAVELFAETEALSAATHRLDAAEGGGLSQYLVALPRDIPLGRALATPDTVVNDWMPSLTVLSTRSEFTKKYLSKAR